MDRLSLAIERADQALATLKEVLSIEDASEIERDAAIQRFEFTFEAVWKTARHFLLQIEGVDAGSPKGVIRACREITILDTDEAVHALELVDDRNLTSHTYDRVLALQIYGRLRQHASLMELWLGRMKQRRDEGDVGWRVR